MRKKLPPASHTPRWLASIALAVVSAGLVACKSTEPQLTSTPAPGSSAFNPGAELLYCAHLRTGIQRRATGVGPVFDKFSADTLGQIRDVVAKYLPEGSYAREEDAERTRAWHDISDYEMRRAKMFPGARDDFIKRAQYCDGLFGRLAPGRTLPAFEQRQTAVGFTQTPATGYGDRVQAAIRPNIVYPEASSIVGNPSAEFEVQVASDGTISRVVLVVSSGIPDWDSAASKGIERTGRLPPDSEGKVPPKLVLVLRPKR